MPGELKISIVMSGDKALLGVQATDCDPKMTVVQGDLAAALARVPSFVEESQQQWAQAKRNPKSTIPEPVKPAPARTTVSTSKKKEPEKAKEGAMKSMF